MNTKAMLKGQVALITGASKGIGRALALGFAAEGAAVACAARTKALLDQTVAEIQKNDGRALTIVTDVTREQDVQQMVRKTIDVFGKLDILVINAGGNYRHSPVEDTDSDLWRKTIELNLFGAYYCAKATVPYLKEGGSGKIIIIGSGLGHRGIANMSAYACAKAGVWMLTRILAQELQQENISVNELIPGPVDTGHISDEFRKAVLETQSEWIKEPQDVVPLALFLASQPGTGPTAQSFSLMRRDN